MNYIWGGIILISILFSAINGNLEQTINAAFDGAQTGITTVLSFAGIMCLWSGFMEAAMQSGVCDFVKKLLKPIIKIIFPRLNKNSAAANYITLNVLGNMLGTGNAATPMGINAINELSKKSDGKVTEEMCLFTVMNTAAFQILPTSIIALRTSFGSGDPAGIIVQVWICSAVALLCAVLFTKFMYKFVYK